MTNNDRPFGFYVAISLVFHLVMFLLFHYGLPSLFNRDLQPQIITFEILPVDSISNVKTQKIQKEKEIEEEKAKKVQKTKADEPEADESKNKEELEAKQESKRDQEEKKPENKKDVVHIKDKVEDKKEKKSNKAEVKQDANKPKPKIPQKKKLPTAKDIDSLLKTLEKASAGKEAASNKRAVAAKSDAIEEAIGQFNEDKPLSISEEQAIRQQIQDKWNVPIGVQNADEIIITLYIAIKPDGSVEQVKIVESKCPVSAGNVCKAAIDSAVRAVWQASPFQNLPPDRYNIWKAFNISFDPKEVLGI